MEENMHVKSNENKLSDAQLHAAHWLCLKDNMIATYRGIVSRALGFDEDITAMCWHC